MSLLKQMLDGLPSDPEWALVELGHRAEEAVKSTLADEDVVLYQVLSSFISRYGLPINSAFSDTYTDTVRIIVHRIGVFEAALNERKIQLEVAAALEQYEVESSRETFGFSRLTEEEKKKVHDRLAKIREIVELSDLNDRKKNALFQRIAALAKEIDLHGTSTDRFFAFAGDLAFVVGDMTNKAKPLINEVKEVLKIVSRSRAREEGVSLPPGDEAVLLPPPESTDSDDEDATNAD